MPDGRPTGRHRRESEPSEPNRVRDRFKTPAARIGLAAGLTCCLGLAVALETRNASEPARTVNSAVTEQAAAARAAAERASAAAAHDAASRANRMAPQTPASAAPTTPAPPAATPKPTPSKTPTRKPTPKKTTTPTATKKATPKATVAKAVAPVAGLTQAQMNNAATIVKTGISMGVPERGLIVAISTAMQESNLYNLASGVLPESQNYPNEGMGYDHDSVGLFQQRTSTGWGTIAELMQPAVAAQKFYAALLQVFGWEQMGIAQAAQTVQVSAFPDAYAKHETNATMVVQALT